MTDDWTTGYLIISFAIVILIACYDGRVDIGAGWVVLMVLAWPLVPVWLAWQWVRRRG